MKDEVSAWIDSQAGHTPLGFGPLAIPPNPVAHNPNEPPFKDVPDAELTPDQLQARKEWVDDERSRVMAEKQRGPVTVYPSPRVSPGGFWGGSGRLWS